MTSSVVSQELFDLLDSSSDHALIYSFISSDGGEERISTAISFNKSTNMPDKKTVHLNNLKPFIADLVESNTVSFSVSYYSGSNQIDLEIEVGKSSLLFCMREISFVALSTMFIPASKIQYYLTSHTLTISYPEYFKVSSHQKIILFIKRINPTSNNSEVEPNVLSGLICGNNFSHGANLLLPSKGAYICIDSNDKNTSGYNLKGILPLENDINDDDYKQLQLHVTLLEININPLTNDVDSTNILGSAFMKMNPLTTDDLIKNTSKDNSEPFYRYSILCQFSGTLVYSEHNKVISSTNKMSRETHNDIDDNSNLNNSNNSIELLMSLCCKDENDLKTIYEKLPKEYNPLPEPLPDVIPPDTLPDTKLTPTRHKDPEVNSQKATEGVAVGEVEGEGKGRGYMESLATTASISASLDVEEGPATDSPPIDVVNVLEPQSPSTTISPEDTDDEILRTSDGAAVTLGSEEEGTELVGGGETAADRVGGDEGGAAEGYGVEERVSEADELVSVSDTASTTTSLLGESIDTADPLVEDMEALPNNLIVPIVNMSDQTLSVLMAADEQNHELKESGEVVKGDAAIVETESDLNDEPVATMLLLSDEVENSQEAMSTYDVTGPAQQLLSSEEVENSQEAMNTYDVTGPAQQLLSSEEVENSQEAMNTYDVTGPAQQLSSEEVENSQEAMNTYDVTGPAQQQLSSEEVENSQEAMNTYDVTGPAQQQLSSGGQLREWNGWVESSTAEGLLYYFNQESQMSQWEAPEGFPVATSDLSQPLAVYPPLDAEAEEALDAGLDAKTTVAGQEQEDSVSDAHAREPATDGKQEEGLVQEGGPEIAANEEGGPEIAANEEGGPEIAANEEGGPEIAANEEGGTEIAANEEGGPEIAANEEGGPEIAAIKHQESEADRDGNGLIQGLSFPSVIVEDPALSLADSTWSELNDNATSSRHLNRRDSESDDQEKDNTPSHLSSSSLSSSSYPTAAAVRTRNSVSAVEESDDDQSTPILSESISTPTLIPTKEIDSKQLLKSESLPLLPQMAERARVAGATSQPSNEHQESNNNNSNHGSNNITERASWNNDVEHTSSIFDSDSLNRSPAEKDVSLSDTALSDTSNALISLQQPRVRPRRRSSSSVALPPIVETAGEGESSSSPSKNEEVSIVTRSHQQFPNQSRLSQSPADNKYRDSGSQQQTDGDLSLSPEPLSKESTSAGTRSKQRRRRASSKSKSLSEPPAISDTTPLHELTWNVGQEVKIVGPPKEVVNHDNTGDGNINISKASNRVETVAVDVREPSWSVMNGRKVPAKPDVRLDGDGEVSDRHELLETIRRLVEENSERGKIISQRDEEARGLREENIRQHERAEAAITALEHRDKEKQQIITFLHNLLSNAFPSTSVLSANLSRSTSSSTTSTTRKEKKILRQIQLDTAQQSLQLYDKSTLIKLMIESVLMLKSLEKDKQKFQTVMNENKDYEVRIQEMNKKINDMEEVRINQAKTIEKMKRKISKMDSYRSTIEMQEKLIAKMQHMIEANLRKSKTGKDSSSSSNMSTDPSKLSTRQHRKLREDLARDQMYSNIDDDDNYDNNGKPKIKEVVGIAIPKGDHHLADNLKAVNDNSSHLQSELPAINVERVITESLISTRDVEVQTENESTLTMGTDAAVEVTLIRCDDANECKDVGVQTVLPEVEEEQQRKEEDKGEERTDVTESSLLTDPEDGALAIRSHSHSQDSGLRTVVDTLDSETQTDHNLNEIINPLPGLNEPLPSESSRALIRSQTEAVMMTNSVVEDVAARGEVSGPDTEIFNALIRFHVESAAMMQSSVQEEVNYENDNVGVESACEEDKNVIISDESISEYTIDVFGEPDVEAKIYQEVVKVEELTDTMIVGVEEQDEQVHLVIEEDVDNLQTGLQPVEQDTIVEVEEEQDSKVDGLQSVGRQVVVQIEEESDQTVLGVEEGYESVIVAVEEQTDVLIPGTEALVRGVFTAIDEDVEVAMGSLEGVSKGMLVSVEDAIDSYELSAVEALGHFRAVILEESIDAERAGVGGMSSSIIIEIEDKVDITPKISEAVERSLVLTLDESKDVILVGLNSINKSMIFNIEESVERQQSISEEDSIEKTVIVSEEDSIEKTVIVSEEDSIEKTVIENDSVTHADEDSSNALKSKIKALEEDVANLRRAEAVKPTLETRETMTESVDHQSAETQTDTNEINPVTELVSVAENSSLFPYSSSLRSNTLKSTTTISTQTDDVPDKVSGDGKSGDIVASKDGVEDGDKDKIISEYKEKKKDWLKKEDELETTVATQAIRISALEDQLFNTATESATEISKLRTQIFEYEMNGGDDDDGVDTGDFNPNAFADLDDDDDNED